MAPRKKAVDEAAVVLPSRVTRSAVRKASESEIPTQPEAKKQKTGEAKAKGAQKKEAKPKKVEVANGNGVSEIVDGGGEKTTAEVTAAKTIVIEHCKQCQSFKRRAEEAKAGLVKGISGISVVFNPDKPRRGCFEIREEGGEKFVTLLELKRPFKAMKDLDMDEVVKDIIDKIK